MNAQIVCDMYGRIISVIAGSPGSAADSTMFQRMDLFKNPKTYFDPCQYLIADAAYAVSQYCIPPFKAPASDDPENVAFNYYLACSCVRNEHCIGVLKGRWQSLKELRHHLQNDSNMKHLCYWVISCCVLHNIMGHIGDRWEVGTEVVQVLPLEPWIATYQATIPGSLFHDSLKKTMIETNEAHGHWHPDV